MKPFVPPTHWIPRFTELHPAFATLRPAADALEDLTEWPGLDALDALLSARSVVNAAGARLRVVAQAVRPTRARQRDRGQRAITELYEAQIAVLGELPTRARSWHDLFGTLVWATFPRAKAALSARHHACLRARLGDHFTTLPNARTREQDMLSLLDEGSVLLLCHRDALGPLTAAVTSAAHDETSRMIRERRVFAMVFGHAIYEHLVAGDDRCHAMPVLLASDEALPDDAVGRAMMADGLLAARLADPMDFTAPTGVSAVPIAGL